MRIVYQKSTVNPLVFVPICHLNDDVGEHVVIVRNPERAVSVQSLLREDGGVNHPLLEDDVYDNLHSIGALDHSAPNHPHQAQTSSSQIVVTPPRILRTTLDGVPQARGNLPECWKTKFSLSVLELLSVFDHSVVTSLGQLSFAPISMSYSTLLQSIMVSSATFASEFLLTMKQRVIDENNIGLMIQMQVLLFLCGINVGPGRESIVSLEYPSILTTCPESNGVTRVFLHPQSTIYRMEKDLFSANNPVHDWAKLLNESADIRDGPYSLRDFGLANSPTKEQKRMYNIGCSYMCAMRRCVQKIIEDHAVIPFNVGFASDIWLGVIRNMEAGNVHTLGITGDALKLVDSIFDFFTENDDPYFHHDPYFRGTSPTVIFTSNGETMAWLVHPVEDIYTLH